MESAPVTGSRPNMAAPEPPTIFHFWKMVRPGSLISSASVAASVPIKLQLPPSKEKLIPGLTTGGTPQLIPGDSGVIIERFDVVKRILSSCAPSSL